MPKPEERASNPRASTAPGGPSAEAIRAARLVVERGGRPGVLGAVLGTGLGGLADRLDEAASIPAHETGHLPKSRATGHAGRIVTGSIAGCPVVVLQGRVHGYEGYDRGTLARGVELLAALGVEAVMLTNASGGLAPTMRGGELVVLEDHVDFVRNRPAGLVVSAMVNGAMADGEAVERIGRVAGSPYDPTLVEVALRAAREAGAIARRGVYAFVSGPSYETRAEYRMLRRFGADVVGMSTVPEAIEAHRLGLRVLAVSVVTNVARPDAPAVTDAEEVCQAAGDAAEGVWAILRAVAATIKGHHAAAAHQ